jgi:hypothetical protein
MHNINSHVIDIRGGQSFLLARCLEILIYLTREHFLLTITEEYAMVVMNECVVFKAVEDNFLFGMIANYLS